MTKIGTVFLVFFFLTALFFPIAHPFTIFLHVFSLVFYVFIYKLVIQTRNRLSNEQILLILRNTKLKMLVGKAFQNALSESIKENLGKNANLYRSLVFDVVFSQQKPNKLIKNQERVLFSLRKISQSQYKTQEQLGSLIQKLQIKHDFRRKSGQILAGVKLQVFFMAGIYFASLVFVLVFISFPILHWIVTTSLGLFLMGSLIAIKLGKQIKWKV